MDLLREQGHVLADVYPGHLGCNRFERSPDLRWCQGLHVPHVQVRGTAQQVDENTTLGTSSTGLGKRRIDGSWHSPGCPGKERHRPRLQKLATGNLWSEGVHEFTRYQG